MNEVETFVWQLFGGATITWHVAIDLKTTIEVAKEGEETQVAHFKTYREALHTICKALVVADWLAWDETLKEFKKEEAH